MPKDTRETVGYYEKESVSFIPSNPDLHPFVVPGTDLANGRYLYLDTLEVKTRQPRQRRTNDWKPFEHYRAFRAAPITGGLVRWESHQLGWSPPVHVRGFSKDARFGLLGFSSIGALKHPFGEPAFPNQGLPQFYLQELDREFVPRPTDFARLYERSLKTMLPIVKDELSVVNSVLELKDFKSLPATLTKAYRFLSKIPSKRRREKETLRQALGGASDGYLQLKFNILPLLSDISGVHAALSRTQRRINDLVSRSGRIRTSHFTTSFTEYNDTTEEADGMFPWRLGSPGGHPATPTMDIYVVPKRYVAYQPTIFHAQMRYNYNYTAYQVQNAELLGLLDAFGVNLNPSIIWNAIPWSFAVDWLVGIGRWLDQFKKTNLEPKINILGYLWSVKRERRIQLSLKQASAYGYSLNATASVPQSPVWETSYRRDLESVTANSVKLSGLNANEFSLGAALVFARRRPHSSART